MRVRSLLLHLEVHDERLGHRLAHRHVGVERAVRDPGTPSACGGARRAGLLAGERAHVDAVEAHGALRRARSVGARAGPVVDLPAPDSPTSARVWPRSRVKLTSSTACDPVGGAPERVALGGEPLGEPLDLEQAHTATSGTTMPGNWSSAARRHRTVDVAEALEAEARPGRSDRARRAGTAGGSGNRAARTRARARCRGCRPGAAPARPPGSRRAGPRCTGAAAGRRRPRRVACSTTWPAYITTTRSVISAITPRSWLMKSTAIPVSSLDLADELEDVRLHGHVERGRRLVGDQERGLARQRHRDHHPLAHAAAERVRVLGRALFGTRDLHPVEHLDRARPRLLARHVLVAAHGLGDLLAHRERGVERPDRLLEDHGDAGAPDVGQLASRTGRPGRVPRSARGR